MILFDGKELDLMLEALDAGDKFLGLTYGKECRMRPKERAAARMAVCSGKNVPHIILRVICTGLEFMYWCEERTDAIIPALLKKIETACGYKRVGMEMRIAAQLEAAEA